MAKLEGKTALITGGTTGIGLATAKRFLREGARLVVTGRNEATLNEARRQLGEGATVIRSDAGNVADQAALAAQLGTSLGHLDVVFINAGTGTFQPLEAIEPEEFDRQFAINVKGPLFLLKALSPLLASPASVILNASIAGRLGMPNTAIYAATKAALLAAMRVSAAEWAERKIRVNAISPGPITTPIYGKGNAEQVTARNNGIRKSRRNREAVEISIFLLVIFASGYPGFLTLGAPLPSKVAPIWRC